MSILEVPWGVSTDSHGGFSTETLVVTEDSTPPEEADSDRPIESIPVLLFAKFPVPGRVKTRLAQTIGDGAAAHLATALLRDSFHRFQGLPDAPLWILGDRREAGSFETLLGSRVSYRPQGEGSLGARLRRAFADPPGGAPGAIAIGADAPHMDPEILSAAAAAVRRGEVALGPALDGGYYLIGVPCGGVDLEALFPDAGWGEPGVLDRARQALQAPSPSGDVVQTQMFGPLRDIDEWEDVLFLGSLLARNSIRPAGGSAPLAESSALDPQLRAAVLLETVLPETVLPETGLPETGLPETGAVSEEKTPVPVLPETGAVVADLIQRS